MDERLEVIARERGVFLTSEALALGYDDRTIQRLTRDGAWHRVRRGAYTFGALWAKHDSLGHHRTLVRAAVRTARTEVLVSHTSAVVEFGIPVWDLDLSEAHLTRTDGRAGRREAKVRQHRGQVADADRFVKNGLPIVTPTRAVLETTAITDAERALVVVNGALHSGLTTEAELAHQLGRMDHWPDTLAADLVLRLADGRLESVAETRTWWLLWRAGLPAPIPQYEIRDKNGLVVARVDFAWPDLGVYLEFDGKVKYTTHLKEGETAADVVMREKRREEMIRSLTGWQCIRLVWSDLENPVTTSARIRAALARAAA